VPVDGRCGDEVPADGDRIFSPNNITTERYGKRARAKNPDFRLVKGRVFRVTAK
jgi:hypothetical protein